MSLALFVYFAGIVGNIQGLLLGVSIIFGLTVFFLFIISVEEHTKFNLKLPVIAWVVCSTLCAIIPDRNTVYLMGAAYAAEKAYDSEMGKDTVKLLHLKIKEQIKAIEQPTQPAKK